MSSLPNRRRIPIYALIALVLVAAAGCGPASTLPAFTYDLVEADERDFAYDARTGESVGSSVPGTRVVGTVVPSAPQDSSKREQPPRTTDVPAPPGARPTSTPVPAATSYPSRTPMAEVMSRPEVSELRLASYRRIDDHVDPKGGGAVYIVDRDVEVRAAVQGIKRMDVSLHLGARDSAAVASGVPDANGEVVVRLQLPEAGVIYVLDGTGVLTDQRPGQSGTGVNRQNEVVIPTNAYRVMAER